MALLVTDTTLRDAHQSLLATRMRTRDMLPIVEKLDQAGFFSLEVWGGATFDVCIRFLNEDPWDRLKAIREKAKNTRLQMLLRGQNLVGYRHYADDVLREFIRLAVKNGVDVFRIFDALNDLRNMEPAMRAVKEFGGHVQGTISYTTSPVHSIEGFADMALELEKLGSDSICIKDMAGLLSPGVTSELVTAIKKKTSLPLDLHSHCSSGMAPMSYHAAVMAGVDIVDTAFSAFSWGTSQPPTESLVAAFKDTPYDTGIDLGLLNEIGEYFATLIPKYRPLFAPETMRPSISALLHQIPGGMLSNLVSQLREQDSLNRLGEVLQEVPRVRADLGYPPLVTPTSQVVGIQAVMNVVAGGRYAKVTKEVKDYFMGLYGRPPAPMNEEIRQLVAGSNGTIDVRPASILEPELEKMRADADKLGILHKEEDAITYALYPQVATKFLRGEIKEEVIPSPAQLPPSEAAPIELPAEFAVDVDGEIFNVKISSVLGKTVETAATKRRNGAKGAVPSPIGGMVLGITVKIGDTVKTGEVVARMEAMKMETEVHAPHDGVVREIIAYEGEVINSGDILMVVTADGE